MCKHEVVINLGSIKKRKCIDCGKEFSWNLNTNQKSLLEDTSELSERDYKKTSPKT